MARSDMLLLESGRWHGVGFRTRTCRDLSLDFNVLELSRQREERGLDPFSLSTQSPAFLASPFTLTVPAPAPWARERNQSAIW